MSEKWIKTMLTLAKVSMTTLFEEQPKLKKALRPVCLEFYQFLKVTFAGDKSFR